MQATCDSNATDSARFPRSKAGKVFAHYVLHPLHGLLFDLRGGVFQADGCQFAIPRNMSTIGWRGVSFGKGEYEAPERELVKRFVSPEDSIIELGGCLGVVSCVTNRLLRDRSRHLVVEANPFLIPWLCRNRELNQSSFIVEHCAMAPPPEVTFYIHSSAVVDGSTQRRSAHGIRLPSRSLRELHERYGPFNTLIADIEGSELSVLEDSGDLLRAYRLVIIELHSSIIGEDKIARCREILSRCGLRMVRKAGVTEAWQRSSDTNVSH